MPGSASTQDNRPPKDRLLDAAEELFASRDFADVSVRELAAAAGMNVAAVNYHFQGKENLYREVIVRRFTAQRDRTLDGLRALLERTEGRPRVEQVIRVVVHEYLDGALSNSFLTLMTRGMHGGHGRTHTAFFREMVQPVFGAISRALLAARPSLTAEDLSWIIASIIAQVHHFILRRIRFTECAETPDIQGFMRSAFPPLDLPREAYIDTVTEHVTRFSAAAIDGLHPEGER